jgi:hypothetical protein
MIGAGKAGALGDVLLAEKQNVAFQDLTLVPWMMTSKPLNREFPI